MTVCGGSFHKHSTWCEIATRETWIKVECVSVKWLVILQQIAKRALLECWMIKLWWDPRPLSSLWSTGQSLKQRCAPVTDSLWKIYFTEPEPRSLAETEKVRKRDATARNRRRPWLNCCMCASFSFTCCDTKPRGAICSRCFNSRRSQQGNKDPANKDTDNRLFKESLHVRQGTSSQRLSLCVNNSYTSYFPVFWAMHN